MTDANSVTTSSVWRGRRGLVVCVGMAVVILFGIIFALGRSGPDPEELLRDARRHLIRGDYAEAEQSAVRAGGIRNASFWTWLVAAEAAARQGHAQRALTHYQRVPPDAGEVSVSAGFGAAEMLCHLGRLSESEAGLRAVLSQDPGHTLSHQRLAVILNITGRRWEATPHLLHVVQQRPGETESLLLLGSTERILDAQDLLKLSRDTVPEDPLPLLGEARRLMALNQNVAAGQLLEEIGDRLSNEPEVWVRRGQLLLESADEGQFLRWYRNVPGTTDEHPEMWVIRGTFALRRQQRDVAVRCFWEVLRRDPEHRAAHYKLGQALTEQGEPGLAAPFLDRADRLLQLSLVLDDLFYHPTQVPLMERAAALSEGLGRIPEAFGWANAALRVAPGTPWAAGTVQRLKPLRPDLLKQTLNETCVARAIDLSHYPLPDWPTVSDPQPQLTERASSEAAIVEFTDDASSAGLQFQYFNSADSRTPGARIFETTGGGVGILDLDADGWPDMVLTQGCEYPSNGGTSDNSDQLFRNEQGHQFQNVTNVSGLREPNFSQGVAAGDYDGDGFQDLYVANLGQNRLFRNNGDGTLSDATETAGLDAALWTTSCLMADLNHDGAPELFDVNYAAGPQLDTLVCERQGKWRACSPRAFEAAPDHLWLNDGTGHFSNVSESSGISVPEGFGLGIVTADLSGDGQLSLFVANDEVPNFLFVNRTTAASALQFAEQAMLAGVAVDGEGDSQGCMGVAVDDADGDGMFDLFITNYYQESNTLYRQLAPRQFSDETRRSGLRDPGFAMLGFGTQFLDAELDGWPDLIVTNGHVDDLRDLGEPWQMPPQFFRNTGRGHYVELPAAQLGPFFSGKYLGRGLARLDWNADGLEDVAISHIDVPASLLTNRTRSPGHFLTVQLRGVQASRDAIGAIVELSCGGRRIVRQLTAGDGYQASNQRQLTFGLGARTIADSLVVRWPRGQTHSWTRLQADQVLVVVEGRDQLCHMPW